MATIDTQGRVQPRENGSPQVPTLQVELVGPAEIRDTILEHIRVLSEHYPARRGLHRMRKHIPWYVKGLPHAAQFRQRIICLDDRQELEAAAREFFDGLA